MKAFLLAALFLLSVLPVIAQNATEESPDKCKIDAQKWYDAIDADHVISTAYSTILDSTIKITDRVKAMNAIDAIRTAIDGADYPPCIEQARVWYLDGLGHLLAVSAGGINGDFSQFFVDAALAYQKIGEFRGFLAGVGVTLYEPPNAMLFFK